MISRAHQYIFELRSILTRTHVISRTGFLSTGYAFLEFILAAITTMMLLTKFTSDIYMGVIVFAVTLLYAYMYRLIVDIDDPFEYSPNDSDYIEGGTGSTSFPNHRLPLPPAI